MSECAECMEKTRKLYDDPRDPPLEEEACLCLDCLLTALADEIETKETEVQDLRAALAAAKGLALAQKRRKR